MVKQVSASSYLTPPPPKKTQPCLQSYAFIVIILIVACRRPRLTPQILDAHTADGRSDDHTTATSNNYNNDNINDSVVVWPLQHHKFHHFPSFPFCSATNFHLTSNSDSFIAARFNRRPFCCVFKPTSIANIVDPLCFCIHHHYC